MRDKNKSFVLYTNGEKTIRVYDENNVPDGFYKGMSFKRIPWNKGLKASYDERVRKNTESAHETMRNNNKYVAWNKGLTKDTDERVLNNYKRSLETIKKKYGVDNVSKLHHTAWNKGLTKETSNSVNKISTSNAGKSAWNKGIHIVGHSQSDKTREKIKNTHLSADFKKKRYDTMKANNTLCVNSDTIAEKMVYAELVNKYGEENIIKQYFDKNRYPFKCDFYVIPEDKFIEVNGNWTHGGMPYNENNINCIDKLITWEEKSKTSKYYKNAIYTWTDLDVRKRKIAEENHLNYEVIYL